MKAHQLIADVLSEWRTVRHAPDLAHELVDRLDDDEFQRLALAGFTAEIRKALTRKHNGVPDYTCITVVNSAGKKERRYKQTEAFTVDDFEVAVKSYERQAQSLHKVAAALVKACAARFGVQLTLVDRDEAAS